TGTAPLGAQPTDPPRWRLVFLLVQGRDREWLRGFVLLVLPLAVLVALIALISGIGGLLPDAWVASWVGGGVLSASSLLVCAQVPRRRRRRLQRNGSANVGES
ncbi:MAG: hypothetical protein ACRDS9_26265, partial [Pseudonocardiaceae bacterium]